MDLRDRVGSALPEVVQHLRPNPVDDSEGYLGSVLSRIDVHAKRALGKWCIDKLRDGFRDGAHVGAIGYDSGKGLLDFLVIAFIGSCFVLPKTLFVGGHAGMREQ